MKSKKMIVSYAGEYLVAARLSMMGYLVTITPKGAPEVDLLVYDLEMNRFTSIQVKTVRQNFVPLGVEATKDNIDEKLKLNIKRPYVVVRLNKSWKDSRFFIVPAEEMRRLAKEEYEKWLRESRHMKPIEELERTPQPLGVSINRIQPFEEKWENIW